jgi:hypothetical protein
MAAASASLPEQREPSIPQSARLGLGPLLSLGVVLARRGSLAVVSMIVSALTALGLCLFAFALARRGGDAPVDSMPIIASSALAWGGGFLQAVSVAASALRRDKAEGIRHLFVTRTTSLRGYVVARVGGLAAVLGLVVGGGTFLVSAVALLAAMNGQVALRTFHASLSAIVYAVAFAAVVAPIAFAALGARTRVSGYFYLLLVLVVPSILANMLSGPVPSELTELCAIPTALAALRSSIAPGSVDVFRFLRALVALAVFAGLGVFFVVRSSTRLEREDG